MSARQQVPRTRTKSPTKPRDNKLTEDSASISNFLEDLASLRFIEPSPDKLKTPSRQGLKCYDGRGMEALLGVR